MYGGGGDGGVAESEAKRKANIDKGMKDIEAKFSGFNDDFYDRRKQDYVAYATPQAMDQYRGTQANLKYALARNGLTRSGAAVEREGSLAKTLTQTQSNIANAAQGEANQLREQVQDQKSNVVNQLIASADPSLAATQAAGATAGLRAPSAFQPIGNMFADWQNAYLANMNARAYDPGVASLWSQLRGGSGASSTLIN